MTLTIGTELERSWNGMPKIDHFYQNVIGNLVSSYDNDRVWNGITEFHGNRVKTRTQHTNTKNCDYTGQNIQDLQERYNNNTNLSGRFFDDASKATSVPVPFQFRSSISMAINQENKAFPVKVKISVLPFQKGGLV